MNKCVEVGDCKSDLEIDFMVGKRLNPKAWPWDNVADFFTEQLHNGGVDMTFEQLQDDGWLTMGQVPSLRAIMPNPLVQINPETAEKYGIEDGDWVCIENPLGKAIEKAQVTPIVDPRVIHAQHGWWYPEQEAEMPNLNGVWKSNINSLIPHKAIGRIGFGAPSKNVACKIYKVDSLDASGTMDPDTPEGAIGTDPASYVAPKEA